MSAENVELIRSMHPGPAVDLAPLVNDAGEAGRLRATIAHLFDPAVHGTFRLPGMAPVAYTGLDGLREAWKDWLSHWSSYHSEIEDVIDAGERVVVVHRCRSRPRPEAEEVTHTRTTIWTLCDRRVTRVDFNVPHAEALAVVSEAP